MVQIVRPIDNLVGNTFERTGETTRANSTGASSSSTCSTVPTALSSSSENSSNSLTSKLQKMCELDKQKVNGMYNMLPHESAIDTMIANGFEEKHFMNKIPRHGQALEFLIEKFGVAALLATEIFPVNTILSAGRFKYIEDCAAVAEPVEFFQSVDTSSLRPFVETIPAHFERLLKEPQEQSSQQQKKQQPQQKQLPQSPQKQSPQQQEKQHQPQTRNRKRKADNAFVYDAIRK